MSQDDSINLALWPKEPDNSLLALAFTPRRTALILGGLMALAFFNVLFGGQSFSYRDFGVLGYPTAYYYKLCFWRGEIPLWNPLSNCGAPFLAQWGTMVLYPFSLIYVLLPMPWSLNFFCLAHLFLGGMGVYYLLRRWTNHSYVACFGAVAFVFNGLTLSCLNWPNYTVAIGWLPWVLYFVEAASTGPGIIVAALVSALQILAGAPELCLLTWALVLGIGILRIRPGGDSPIRWKAFFQEKGSVIAITSGLVLAQILPFLELLLHSQRTIAPATSKWSLPPWGLGNLLVPLLHCFKTSEGTFYQYGQEFLSSCYVGGTLLVLAVVGTHAVKHRVIRFLAAAAIVAAVLALGEKGFVYQLCLKWFPMMGFARYPIKFLLILCFLIPVLAGCGLAAWLHPSANRTPKVLFGAAAIGVALMLGLLWVAKAHPFPYDQWKATWQNSLVRLAIFCFGVVLASLLRNPGASGQMGAGLILLGLTAFDGMTHLPKQNPTIPASTFSPGLWKLHNQGSAPAHGVSRAMITAAAEKRLLQSGVGDLTKDMIGKRLALWSHLNLIEEIPKINGSSTLQVRAQFELQQRLYANTNSSSGLLDFLGVSMTTDPTNILDWIPSRTYLPFASAAASIQFLPKEAIPDKLFEKDFDPRREIYLPQELSGVGKSGPGSSARIEALRCTAQSISAEVEAAERWTLVLAQSHYPAWRAYVDDRRVEIWRANHAFQAVPIPAGKHQVRVVYDDWYFRIGAVVSALTLAACIAVWRRKSSSR